MKLEAEVTYDEESHSLYIDLGKPHTIIKVTRPGIIYLDLGEDGNLVGIEILLPNDIGIQN